MRIRSRRIETILILMGLLMAMMPMVVFSRKIVDNFRTTENVPEHLENSNQKLRTKSESAEIVMLSSALVRSRDFPPIIQHKPTIRWKFLKEDGVWGVKFHAFSLPYTNGCISDYLFIRDLSHKNHKVVHCGEKTPEEFISHGSEIEVEFHSESIEKFPLFDFRVDHGDDEDDIRRQFAKEPMEPTPFVIEVPVKMSKEEKAAIISLSIILPIVLVIAGLLAIALAKPMIGEKESKKEGLLPTFCSKPKKLDSSKPSSHEESTVLDFFLDNDKLTVKPGKVRLQDKRNETTPMSNDYADLPTSLEICSTIASHDIQLPPQPPKFDEKIIGFGSLM